MTTPLRPKPYVLSIDLPKPSSPIGQSITITSIHGRHNVCNHFPSADWSELLAVLFWCATCRGQHSWLLVSAADRDFIQEVTLGIVRGAMWFVRWFFRGDEGFFHASRGDTSVSARVGLGRKWGSAFLSGRLCVGKGQIAGIAFG